MKLPIPRHLEAVPADASADGGVDEQLLAIFFDQMPMGIAVFGTDLCLQRCSRSWAAFFVTYLGVEESYVRPGASIFELIPDNEEALRPLLEGVLAGNVVRQQAHRLEKDGVVTFWDVVFAPVFADGEVVGFVDIVTDATERRLAYEALETRVSVLARLASAMTVDQPLGVTIQQAAAAAVEATGAVVGVCEVQPPQGEPILATAGGADEARADLLDAVRGVDDGDLPGDVAVFAVAIGERRFGRLLVRHPAAYDSEDELATLRAIADLAAAALENARLYARAEEHATTLEKQRLARELHDSVSQALFSMTLHARTAQRLLAQVDAAGDEQVGQVGEQLQRLTELTSGALAEMRALIFELRPGALAEEGLAAALTRQAQAIAAREGVPVAVRAPQQRLPLTPAAEEHVYRVALEALHNAAKHARASRLEVELVVDEPAGVLVVRVRDDGAGFDPAAPHPGHLGQHTMRERAAAVSGTLTVMSAPGAGTVVELRAPLAP